MGDQEIRQAWEKLWKESNGGQIVAPLDLVLQTIDVLILLDVKCKMNETEGANIAPVVRCRECVHNHPEFVKNEAQWCELCRITINPDDFCSRGERIESPTCHDGVCEIPGVEREEDYE